MVFGGKGTIFFAYMQIFLIFYFVYCVRIEFGHGSAVLFVPFGGIFAAVRFFVLRRLPVGISPSSISSPFRGPGGFLLPPFFYCVRIEFGHGFAVLSPPLRRPLSSISGRCYRPPHLFFRLVVFSSCCFFVLLFLRSVVSSFCWRDFSSAPPSHPPFPAVAIVMLLSFYWDIIGWLLGYYWVIIGLFV